MTYPKLPGPPTEPGYYWFSHVGDDVAEIYAVARRLCDGELIASQADGITDIPVALAPPGTWYGPIPPPQTGERKPARGWVQDTQSQYAWRLGGWAAVSGNATSGYCATNAWEKTATGHQYVRFDTLKAAQLAAEDAVLAEAQATINAITGWQQE